MPTKVAQYEAEEVRRAGHSGDRVCLPRAHERAAARAKTAEHVA